MIPLFPFGVREFRRRTPTTDLYVLNPLRRLARQGEGASSRPLIVHLFANVYAIGQTCIISRTASLEELRRVQAKGFRQIVYVVDDDFEAGAGDPLLPEAYRAKLGAFAAGPLRELKAMADVVVASSPVIAAIYGSKAQVVQPAWAQRPAAFGHFARHDAFDIAHLGTGSHASDLELLGQELLSLLEAHPQVRLTLFAAGGRPDSARSHPRIRIRGAMAWWRYKLVVPRLRFHLAIYPLQDSRFNAARSANKFFEHALVGAASLMTPIRALRDAADGLSDIFIDGDAGDWRARIEADIANPDACRARAERTRAHILASDPLEAGARKWRAILAHELDG